MSFFYFNFSIVFFNRRSSFQMALPPVVDCITQTSGASYQGKTAHAISGGDKAADKCAARARRITSGMQEASDICKEAVESVGGTSASFAEACSTYFTRLCRVTEVFSKGGVTYRVILQFGLACAYMHREGFVVGDTTLFRPFDKFGTHLPKTYALTKAGHKVRSITRIQDAIRRLVRDIDTSKQRIDDFKFPPFT